MSRENVEIAKRWEAAFNRRDWAALDGMISPDFEWFPAMPGTVEGHGYRGHDGFARYVRELEAIWKDLPAVFEEFRDLSDRVLSLGRMEALGRGSGVKVDAPLGVIYEFRGGQLSRIRVFLDHSEALRAAGLAR